MLIKKLPIKIKIGLMSFGLVAFSLTGLVLSQKNPVVSAQSESGASKSAPPKPSTTKAQAAAKAAAKAKATTEAKAAAAKQTAPVAAAKPTPSLSPAPAVSAGASLYANPYSNVAGNARAWAAAHPEDAGIMNRLASTPMAQWFGGWNGNVQADANAYVSAAGSQIPVLVAYNIPQRDCGSYSAGGAGSGEAYKSWINSLAAGIGQRQSIIIIEPDALAGMDCLGAADRTARQQLLTYAVQTLRTQTRAAIYLDAGHVNWQTPGIIAGRLQASGIAQATGFSLNVSNYISNAANAGYGQQVSALLGGKHFVIDTSRNGGNVAGGEWCNPTGAIVGASPSLSTSNGLIDGYLWIKNPGESDGQCGMPGAPAAGQWWGEYAAMLARGAGW